MSVPGKRPRPGRPQKEQTRLRRREIIEAILDLQARTAHGEPGAILEPHAIAARLNVDPKTVVRIVTEIKDLAWLLTPVPGGKGFRLGSDAYYHRQLRIGRELKDGVAAQMARVVPSGSSLACSPGTTTAACIRELIRSGLHVYVVTNNVGVLDAVRSPEIPIVFTGGTYVPEIHACVGVEAETAFASAKCRVALVGVSGIDSAGRLFVGHREEGPILRHILDSTTETIIIAADITKLTRTDVWSFCDLPDYAARSPKRDFILVTNPLNALDHDPAAHKQARLVLERIKPLVRPVGLEV